MLVKVGIYKQIHDSLSEPHSEADECDTDEAHGTVELPDANGGQ